MMHSQTEHVGMARRTRLVHFVGIGGIGMSGIAEILLNLGYRVQGSDLRKSDTTQRLASLGAKIFVGHDQGHVGGADVVVTSSALASDNVEVEAARNRKIPVIRRAEMLAELMRLKFGIAVSGTHGKTTTTSLTGALLAHAGLSPTIIVGGKVNRLGSTAQLGRGPYLVAEADESDGSFLHLFPSIAVVTNIDAEHLDHYRGGLREIQRAFCDFVNRIPFYGLAVLCVDHPGVQAIVPDVERRFVTYGLSAQADYCAKNLEFSCDAIDFDLVRHGVPGERFRLPMLGVHNVLNALAALAVADELGVDDKVGKEALQEFDGVDRRFSVRGVVSDVVVVDDYGHHPEEIRTTLRGARLAYPNRRFVVVFQPHRYTRTRDLFVDFATAFHDADVLLVTPIYPAGEAAIDGVNHDALIEDIRKHGHRDARRLADVSDAVDALAQESKPGDLVIAFGAGDVSTVASTLIGRLKERQS